MSSSPTTGHPDSPAFFRLATVADLPTIVELGRAYYGEDGYAFDPEAYERAARGLIEDERRGRLYVAASGATILGYLALTFGYSLEYHGVDAFVDEVYFRAQARGQGLGRRAVELAIEVCRTAGAHALHLEVERDKAGAQHLYRGLGFKEHDRYLWTLSLG